MANVDKLISESRFIKWLITQEGWSVEATGEVVRGRAIIKFTPRDKLRPGIAVTFDTLVVGRDSPFAYFERSDLNGCYYVAFRNDISPWDKHVSVSCSLWLASNQPPGEQRDKVYEIYMSIKGQ